MACDAGRGPGEKCGLERIRFGWNRFNRSLPSWSATELASCPITSCPDLFRGPVRPGKPMLGASLGFRGILDPGTGPRKAGPLTPALSPPGRGRVAAPTRPHLLPSRLREGPGEGESGGSPRPASQIVSAPPHPGPLPAGERESCGAGPHLLPSRLREGPGENRAVRRGRRARSSPRPSPRRGPPTRPHLLSSRLREGPGEGESGGSPRPASQIVSAPPPRHAARSTPARMSAPMLPPTRAAESLSPSRAAWA